MILIICYTKNNSFFKEKLCIHYVHSVPAVPAVAAVAALHI
jgi:hypothetical protein